MSTELLDPELMDFVDNMEAKMVASCPIVECPLTHRFVPGLYCREILMPAGSLVTSKIHKTEHFFTILEGSGYVWNNGEAKPYKACGQIEVTKPGTRRIIFTIEDTRWATFHVHDSQDLDEIEAGIIKDHVNPLLPAKELL